MQYQEAPEYAGHYTQADYGGGSAFYVLGWELEPVAVIGCTGCDYHAIERDGGGGKVFVAHDPDCPHQDDAKLFQSDEPDYERTGNLVCVMVGDDRRHSADPSDLELIAEDSFCRECGQVDCGCCLYA